MGKTEKCERLRRDPFGEFAVGVGTEAIMTFLTAEFYDPIMPAHVSQVYNRVAQVAEKAGIGVQLQAELSRRILEESNKIKPALRNAIMSRLRG